MLFIEEFWVITVEMRMHMVSAKSFFSIFLNVVASRYA